MEREPDFTWWDETRAVARRQACGDGASDAAEDLAQDLAVAALERGAGASRLGAWLERVGRNARIDRWRSERRRGELAAAIEAPAASPDPEAGALARERRGLVRRALASLPRPLRRAALARFHADLSFEGVAARLGTPEVTARTRVHRALARLRERVGGLRVLLAPLPGAQATVLGLTLVAGVARPALFPVAASVGSEARVVAPTSQVRRLAEAPAAVIAAPTPVAPPVAAPRAVRAPPLRVPAAPTAFPPAVQRIDFGDDLVEGDHQVPDGVVVRGAPTVWQPSLIELRWHFLPELVKTLEDY